MHSRGESMVLKIDETEELVCLMIIVYIIFLYGNNIHCMSKKLVIVTFW